MSGKDTITILFVFSNIWENASSDWLLGYLSSSAIKIA